MKRNNKKKKRKMMMMMMMMKKKKKKKKTKKVDRACSLEAKVLPGITATDTSAEGHAGGASLTPTPLEVDETDQGGNSLHPGT